MKPVSDNWIRIANLADPLDTMRAIDINVKKDTDFQADRGQLRRLTITLDEDRPQTVIDFGAGMLRNTLAIRDFGPYWTVIAYDSEPMLRRGWEVARLDPASFPSSGQVKCCWDWSKLSELAPQSVNAIVASIVLQHLPEAELREALADFAKISPWLCIWGRQRLDESAEKSVWKIVAETWDLRWGSDRILENPDPEAHAFGVWHRRK